FWGAILATIPYIQKLLERRKISVGYGFVPDSECLSSKNYIVLIVKNFGDIPITLSYTYVEEVLPLKQRLKHKILGKIFHKPRQQAANYLNIRINNKEVVRGKQVAIPILISDVEKTWLERSVNLRAIVVDQLGTIYRSKIIPEYRYPYAKNNTGNLMVNYVSF